jgi:hypothetical protein
MKLKSLALVLAMAMCITQNTSYASSLPSTQAAKPDNLMSEISRQPVQYTSLLELADHSSLAPLTAEQLASISGGADINRFAVLTPNQFWILTIGWLAYQGGNQSLKQVLDYSGIHNGWLRAADVTFCDVLGTLLPGYARQSQLGAAAARPGQPARDFDVIDGLIGVSGGLLGALGATACKMSLHQTQVKWDEETVKMDKRVVDAVNANVTNSPNGRRLAALGVAANDFIKWYADDLTTNNADAAYAKMQSEFWGKQYSECKYSGRPYYSCLGYLDKVDASINEFTKRFNWAESNLHDLVYKSGEWANALGVQMPSGPTIGGRRMGPKFYPIYNDPDMSNPNAHH